MKNWLKPSIVAGLLVTLVLCTSGKNDVTKFAIAENGKAKCVILRGAAPTESEKLAEKELLEHLAKITGATFEVFDEKSAPQGTPAVYLGWTELAKKEGLDFGKMEETEWLIRSDSEKIIIGGGRPQGTLRAVYRLLEDQFGVHWLSGDCDIIPQNANLSVGALDINGKPAIPSYTIYNNYSTRKPTSDAGGKDRMFKIRNGDGDRMPEKSWVLRLGPASPRRAIHNYLMYVSPESYFKDHPEYFSDDGTGRRFCKPITQLCLTSPDVKRIALESLKKFITEDRVKLPRENWPVVYDISAEDGTNFICKCKNCAAVTEREGSESGLVLGLVNYLAEEIVKDYPEIWIRTFAYTSTEKAPKHVRPGKNVMIQLCDAYSLSSCFRPLSDKVNAKRMEILNDWLMLTPNIYLWDYWVMGFDAIRKCSAPETIVDAIAADTRFFADKHLLGVFIEAEEGLDAQSFNDLHYWLGYQLALNPDREIEPLLHTFLSGYYGKAAPQMKAYLDFLRETMKNEPKPMYWTPDIEKEHLTSEFVLKCRDFILNAMKTVVEDNTVKTRLYRELAVADICILVKWNRFKAGLDSNKISRETIMAEYRASIDNMVEAYTNPKAKEEVRNRFYQKITQLTLVVPIDDKFTGLSDKDFMAYAWPVMGIGASGFGGVIDDGDSVMKKALAFTAQDLKYHSTPPVFGLYDEATKMMGPNLKIKDAPKDEKYHWYKIGRFNYGRQVRVWAHDTWYMGGADVSGAYVSADGVEGKPNEWDTWVSVKITGSAYVPDSKKENRIYLDRVVLVRPGKFKE